MKLSVPALGAALALAAAGAVTGATPAAAGDTTGCWRNLGCVGGPAYGYAPPRPAYGYAPYRPAGGYYAYGAPAYGGECYTVRRRFVDDWGRVMVRRTRVCD
jgi:hypothetical protein